MIAKGLDFPNVTLVGVVNADTALHLPDFRAAERTFQLLVQVAGRTGRGSQGGRVLVQTFTPDHPAILAAVRHDYASFANRELPLRQLLPYPPYAEMIRIIVRGPQENTTRGLRRGDWRACSAVARRRRLGAGPRACPGADRQAARQVPLSTAIARALMAASFARRSDGASGPQGPGRGAVDRRRRPAGHAVASWLAAPLARQQSLRRTAAKHADLPAPIGAPAFDLGPRPRGPLQ